jgi:hypothetical protein
MPNRKIHAPSGAPTTMIKRHLRAKSLVSFTAVVSVILPGPLDFGLLDVRTLAQSRQVPAPPQKEPVLIRGATVHPVSTAAIDNGFVIFDNGVITAVGQGDPPSSLIPPGAVKLDAEGMHIYPGLVAASTILGLTEVGDIEQTHDYTELGRIKPEVRAATAINPDSDLIPVARSNGILTALVFPRGGLVPGRCSSVRLDGWTWEAMAAPPFDADAGLVINWPRTEPITAPWMDRSEEQQRKEIKDDLDAVEKVFDQAVAYIKARDADSTVAPDLRYEAMRPALQGEPRKPVFVSASSVGQIESAVAWAQRRNLKIVIVGGDQADKAAPLLTKHNIPVIIGGIHRLPSRRHDHYDRPFTLPARLHELGVRFCIASGADAAHERNLNHMAGAAAAFGLPKDQAIKAVTLWAAQIIGIGDKYGSIETGKSATLILTTGDPLEITTDTLVAYIDGRRIDLGNRQKSLYDKYQEKYRQLGIQRRP